ncbi:unnamed protein product [Arctogadus glacialis]
MPTSQPVIPAAFLEGWSGSVRLRVPPPRSLAPAVTGPGGHWPPLGTSTGLLPTDLLHQRAFHDSAIASGQLSKSVTPKR